MIDAKATLQELMDSVETVLKVIEADCNDVTKDTVAIVELRKLYGEIDSNWDEIGSA